MDNPVNLTLSSSQAFFILAFWAWLIIAPILIMRKLDRLTQFLEERFGDPQEPPGEEKEGEDA